MFLHNQVIGKFIPAALQHSSTGKDTGVMRSMFIDVRYKSRKRRLGSEERHGGGSPYRVNRCVMFAGYPMFWFSL